MMELRQLVAGQKCENTLYFYKAAGWIPQGYADMGSAMQSWWEGTYSTYISNQVTLTEVYITDLTTNIAPTYTGVPTTEIHGQNNDEPVPNNSAYCIGFRTPLRGKSNRGRNYVLGLGNAAVDKSSVLPAVSAQLVAAYNAIITIALNNDCNWVVVSRYHNKQPRVEGTYTAINAAVAADLYMDSQRRRLPGRGK